MNAKNLRWNCTVLPFYLLPLPVRHIGFNKSDLIFQSLVCISGNYDYDINVFKASGYPVIIIIPVSTTVRIVVSKAEIEIAVRYVEIAVVTLKLLWRRS